ncbi:MAG TPA: hypothetical protein EYN54_12735 [Methylococcaceae bacterium]|nr:hypothetical protein [Methylococcaceae bacterium]
MSENIWRDFAELNGMSPKEFENKIITVAQAVLAMKLNKDNKDALKITAVQNDGVYELAFKRIIK